MHPVEITYIALALVSSLFFVLYVNNIRIILFLSLALVGGFFFSGPLYDGRGAIVLLLFLVVALLYLFRLVTADIFHIFCSMGLGKALRVVILSFLLWSPIILLALLSVNLKILYEQVAWEGCHAQLGLYNYTGSGFSARSTVTGDNFWLSRADEDDANTPKKTSFLYNKLCGKEVSLSKNTHEENLLDTVDRHTEALRSNLLIRVDKGTENITTAQESSTKAVLKVLFDKETGLIPQELPEGLQPPRCRGWLVSPTPCLKRKLLSPLNSAYENRVKNFKLAVVSQLENQQNYGDNLVSQVSILTNRFITEEINGYNSDSKSGIKIAFSTARFLDIMGLIILIIVMIKTYFYVLARLVFSHDVGGQILYLSDSKNHVLKPIKALDITGDNHSFSVPLNGEVWFASFSGDIKASINAKSWWRRINETFLVRFVSQKLALQKFIPKKHDVVAGFSNNNYRFYLIHLEKEQELCFHFNNLVAFSTGIHFKRVLKPRLSAFLQYQLFFSTAEGEGYLVIKAEGGSGEIMNTGENRLTADPLDILAFDMQGSFTSFAEIDLLSTYTRASTIQPSSDTLAIRHSPKRLIHTVWLRVRKILFFFVPI